MGFHQDTSAPRRFAIATKGHSGHVLQQLLKRAAGLTDAHRMESITCDAPTGKLVKFHVTLIGDADAVQKALDDWQGKPEPETPPRSREEVVEELKAVPYG